MLKITSEFYPTQGAPEVLLGLHKHIGICVRVCVLNECIWKYTIDRQLDLLEAVITNCDYQVNFRMPSY